MTEYWYSTEYSRAKCRHGMVKGIPCEACMAEPKTDAQHLTDFVGNATFAGGQPVAPRVTEMSDLSVPKIKDAILCKLVSMAMEFAADGRSKDELGRLVSAWGNAVDQSVPTVDPIDALKLQIDTRLNNHLCGMEPDCDDAITGFNAAWDIIRTVFRERLNR